MERFYKRKAPDSVTSARNSCRLDDINWEEEIKYDPGLRKDIDAYHPNQREREGNIWRMDHANLARAIFPLHRLGKRIIQEGFNQNGSMSLEVGLNTVNQKIEHIVSVVSCLEKRRMSDMLSMVGMVITGKSG